METISEDTSSCPARDRRSCVGARVIKPPRQQTSPRQAPAVSWFGRWSLSPDTRRTPGSACSLKSAKSGERCGSCASDCDEGLSPAHGRSSCPANLDETAASCGSTCGAPNGAVVQSTSASPNALRGPRAHRDVNSMGSRSASPGARRCSHHNSITFAEQPTSPSRASRVSRASRGSSQYPGGGAGPGDAAGKSSCFYVHMLKTNHYRAGGWRRDIMRNEMSEIGEAELHDLSAAAQAAHLQVLQLSCMVTPSTGPPRHAQERTGCQEPPAPANLLPAGSHDKEQAHRPVPPTPRLTPPNPCADGPRVAATSRQVGCTIQRLFEPNAQ